MMMMGQWHPADDATLLGGLANGQIVLWDLEQHMAALESGLCTWDHKKMSAGDDCQDWNEDKGFIPVVEWSAESSISGGHMEEVMDIQFVPPTIKFDQESAFPKDLFFLICIPLCIFLGPWSLGNRH